MSPPVTAFERRTPKRPQDTDGCDGYRTARGEEKVVSLRQRENGSAAASPNGHRFSRLRSQARYTIVTNAVSAMVPQMSLLRMKASQVLTPCSHPPRGMRMLLPMISTSTTAAVMATAMPVCTALFTNLGTEKLFFPSTIMVRSVIRRLIV
jgi:hypothetical protein